MIHFLGSQCLAYEKYIIIFSYIRCTEYLFVGNIDLFYEYRLNCKEGFTD